MKYIPQFDTIRTIAVTLVLFEHWLPGDRINYFNNGLIGVILFFVLSGYLITNILYKARITRPSGSSSWKVLANFYVRRVLRIFPIYYVVLLFLFMVSFQEIRDQFVYYLTYAQNILFVTKNQTYGYLIHFWTLAVEEQFYLIWPFVILFVPLKRLKLAIIISIILGTFFRILFDNSDVIIGPSNYLMPGAIDAFALGALAAVLNQENLLEGLIKKKIPLILLVLAFMFHVFTGIIDYFLLLSVISLVLIIYVQIGKGKIFDFFFKNRLIMFYGKISYGIYLFHYLMYPMNHWLHLLVVEYNIRIPFFNVILFPEFGNMYLRFIYFLVLVFIISSISWFVIEKPFNNLKNRFQ